MEYTLQEIASEPKEYVIRTISQFNQNVFRSGVGGWGVLNQKNTILKKNAATCGNKLYFKKVVICVTR